MPVDEGIDAELFVGAGVDVVRPGVAEVAQPAPQPEIMSDVFSIPEIIPLNFF